jgi:Rod binding domain-containing protein
MQMITAVPVVAEAVCPASPRLVRAAHEFEAQMMKELLRPITQQDEGGNETGYGGALSEFAGEALAQSLSRAGGIGMGNRIMASLSRTETDCGSGSVAGKHAHGAGVALK